jgi:ABC-type multidrug transport system permease subunit
VKKIKDFFFFYKKINGKNYKIGEEFQLLFFSLKNINQQHLFFIQKKKKNSNNFSPDLSFGRFAFVHDDTSVFGRADNSGAESDI